jgi:acetolactate synthase-1/2/3 large subunit
MAFRHATMGRPGPVFLELPPDILNISIPEEEAPLPKHPTRKYTVHPDDADLKQAADLINSAKQPLVLGGSGVGFSRCGEALRCAPPCSGRASARLGTWVPLTRWKSSSRS